MSHFSSIAMVGGLWLAIGVFLLNMGFHLLLGEGSTAATPLLDWAAPLFGGREAAALMALVAALLVGYYKAKMVFSRVVRKMVDRLTALPAPISLSQIYGVRYLLLIAFMIGLGAAMRWSGVPPDIRGMVDVAVGAALVNGGVSYLRHAFALRAGKNHL